MSGAWSLERVHARTLGHRLGLAGRVALRGEREKREGKHGGDREKVAGEIQWICEPVNDLVQRPSGRDDNASTEPKTALLRCIGPSKATDPRSGCHGK